MDQERNEEVRPAHAREAESREGYDRPERHLDFALVLSGSPHRKVDGENADRKRDGGKNAENQEEEIVGHKNYLRASTGLISTENRMEIISTVATIESAMPMGIG